MVALKFITKAGKSSRDLAGLRSEVAILQSLRHEHIVSLLDSFETKEAFVLVTEFAHGELYEVLEDDGQLGEACGRLPSNWCARSTTFTPTASSTAT